MTITVLNKLSHDVPKGSSRVARRQGSNSDQDDSAYTFGLVEKISGQDSFLERERRRSSLAVNAAVRRYSGWLSRANQLVSLLRLASSELGQLEGLTFKLVEDAQSSADSVAAAQSEPLATQIEAKRDVAMNLLHSFQQEAHGFISTESLASLRGIKPPDLVREPVEIAQEVATTKRLVEWTLQQLIATLEQQLSRQPHFFSGEDKSSEEAALDSACLLSSRIDSGASMAMIAQANLDPQLAVRLLRSDQQYNN